MFSKRFLRHTNAKSIVRNNLTLFKFPTFRKVKEDLSSYNLLGETTSVLTKNKNDWFITFSKLIFCDKFFHNLPREITVLYLRISEKIRSGLGR